MADYGNFFEELMNLDEGKTLTDTKGDGGGRSFCGISEVSFPRLSLWVMLDGLGVEVGETCPAAMPIVKQFYKANFWDLVSGDLINDQAFANKLASDAVNMGVTVAIKLCQESLNIQQDGRMGSNTLNAINA